MPQTTPAMGSVGRPVGPSPCEPDPARPTPPTPARDSAWALYEGATTLTRCNCQCKDCCERLHAKVRRRQPVRADDEHLRDEGGASPDV